MHHPLCWRILSGVEPFQLFSAQKQIAVQIWSNILYLPSVVSMAKWNWRYHDQSAKSVWWRWLDAFNRKYIRYCKAWINVFLLLLLVSNNSLLLLLLSMLFIPSHFAYYYLCNFCNVHVKYVAVHLCLNIIVKCITGCLSNALLCNNSRYDYAKPLKYNFR